METEKKQAVVKLTEKLEREKKRKADGNFDCCRTVDNGATVESQKAVAMIRSLQAQHAEELQKQRQSACEELEATKAQHHAIISEMTEKHLAEMGTAKETMTQKIMEHPQESKPSLENKYLICLSVCVCLCLCVYTCTHVCMRVLSYWSLQIKT